MNYNINNYSLESQHRNRILHFLYDRIPSYALFDSDTIKNESILNRYTWWKEIQSEKKYNQNIEIENILNKWIQCFSISLNKKPVSKYNNINNDYCSKRFTDELNCDI